MFHSLFVLKVVVVLWSSPPHPPPVLQPTCATLYSCARAVAFTQAKGGLLHAVPDAPLIAGMALDAFGDQ